MTLLTFDLHADPISAELAAELAAVSLQVVRNWASRGYRDPADRQWKRIRTAHDERGRACYYGIDILRAEAATRARARRKLDPPA